MTVAASVSDSDAELARSVLTAAPGARHAESELCRRFGPRVRSYGLRHLGSPDAANELCQRVLVLVLEKLRGNEVRDVEGIASFVFGTAHRVAQAMRRGERRQEPLSASEEPWHEPAPAHTLDVRRVATCMQELAERDRTVVALSFFDELGAAEIAATVGSTAGHVRVMRHRALIQLRECFERPAEAS